MGNFLANKNILLGVTGSIAAYKSADLVRRLRDAGAHVRVAMTTNAKRFITPLTMQAVSGNPVHDELFDLHAEAAMGHIELARWADGVLIAPASADFMARLAHGNADDLLTTLCLATRAPIALAPAMNQAMWLHALTQTNRQTLENNGIKILEPAAGSQACGDIGPGRMLEPAELVLQLNTLFASGLLGGCNVMITAGPTQEDIDPVRYISNRSSGKMGYALAEAAQEAGANVTLVSGPVHLAAPRGVKLISVVSAQAMQAAVQENISSCDIFIAVAAVGDFRCAQIAEQKIHRTGETLTLKLEPNPDIVRCVAQLPDKPFVVGFAAETENVVEAAKNKLRRKNLDMIVSNLVGLDIAMGTDDNAVSVITEHSQVNLVKASKTRLARQLIELIVKEFKNNHDGKINCNSSKNFGFTHRR